MYLLIDCARLVAAAEAGKASFSVTGIGNISSRHAINIRRLALPMPTCKKIESLEICLRLQYGPAQAYPPGAGRELVVLREPGEASASNCIGEMFPRRQ